MEQTVRLLDGLGERHGAVHIYSNLRSPADAIKLLCLNSPAFQKELVEAHKDGVGYQVIQGGRAIGSYGELALPFGSKDLYIVPVVIGSGGNTGRSVGLIALGVGLIAFSIITAGAGSGFLGLGQGLGFLGGPLAPGIATQMFAGANIVSSIAGGIGLSMAISGVTSLVAPQPMLPKPTGMGRLQTRSGGSGDNIRATGTRGLSQATNQDQTYLYTGARNSSGPGAIVPVVFGKALVGSHLLGLDVVVDDTDKSSYVTQVTTGGPNEVEIQSDVVTNEYKALGGGLRTRMIRDNDLKPHNGLTGVRDSRDATDGGSLYHDTVQQETVISFNSENKSALQGAPYILNQNRAYGLRDEKESHRWKTYNWEIVLRLPNGLFDYVTPNLPPVANKKPAGQQRQPGWITYEVELQSSGRYNTDSKPTIAKFTATVNANLDPTYPSDGFSKGFTWVHSVNYGQIDNVFQHDGDLVTDNFRIRPVLTIVDFDLAGKNYFKLEVVQTGYKNVANGLGPATRFSGQRQEHDSYGKLQVGQFDFL